MGSQASRRTRGAGPKVPLDGAQRWTSDMFRVCEPAGACVFLDVDMTRAVELRRDLAALATPVSVTVLLVKAAALALAGRPQLNVVRGTRRELRPPGVDIGLSVAGESPCAPVMVLVDADRRSLRSLGEEVVRRLPEVRQQEARSLSMLRTWGRLVPLGAARRALLRAFLSDPARRHSVTGSFQVTSLPEVDLPVPLGFLATGVLAAGRVRDKVVAVDGRPEVRPILTLCCAFNHKVWDGRRAAEFLGAVREVLEADRLRSTDAVGERALSG